MTVRVTPVPTAAPDSAGRADGSAPVLVVRDLVVEYPTGRGPIRAVDGVSFEAYAGQTVGIVGESGSGKTTVAMAVMGLAEAVGASSCHGQITVAGRDMLALPQRRRPELRGGVVSLVFQDPMSSFNPMWPVGAQLLETIRAHNPGISRADARARAELLLDRVRMPNVKRQMSALPSQMSGGMLQRAMIAVAIANQPRVILADEPATALDVTVQAQIIELFREVLAETDAALIVVTHDFGIVAELADRVLVMYGGRVVEVGPVQAIFDEPRFPYSAALLASRPSIDFAVGRRTFASIPGSPASPAALPSGCAFHPRCPVSAGRRRCVEEVPPLYDIGGGRASACYFHNELARGENLRQGADSE